MIAFGGAAPLHAARLAQKLDVGRVIVPSGAGVGSAIGMLRAAVSYEVVRSRYMRLVDFDARRANALLAGMHAEAWAVIAAGAGESGQPEEVRHAYMRYVGQGHEIVVPLPIRALEHGDGETLADAFDAEYARLYGRTLPDQEREVLSWTLTLTAPKSSPPPTAEHDGAHPPVREVVPSPSGESSAGSGRAGVSNPPASGPRRLFDPLLAEYTDAAVHRRTALAGDAVVPGPAVIVEEQTTTVVPDGFCATVNPLGYLILERTGPVA